MPSSTPSDRDGFFAHSIDTVDAEIIDDVPRYALVSPEGRRLECLDLPNLVMLYRCLGRRAGWRIATM